MLIDLEMIKKHLNIDADYTDDDKYLVYLYGVAESIVERHIDKELEDIIAEQGEIPKPLVHCILLLIGNLYDNRESIAYGTPTEIPMTLQYLLSSYRDYSNANI